MATSTVPLPPKIGFNGGSSGTTAGVASEQEQLMRIAELGTAIEHLRHEREALFAELRRLCLPFTPLGDSA